MNNFTKEELEWLYDEIDGVIEQFEYEDERSYSCRDKLKSMIDNYCEHRLYQHINEFIGFCQECGALMVRRDNNE